MHDYTMWVHTVLCNLQLVTSRLYIQTSAACASTIDNDSLLLLGVDFDDSEWYYNIFITTSSMLLMHLHSLHSIIDLQDRLL